MRVKETTYESALPLERRDLSVCRICSSPNDEPFSPCRSSRRSNSLQREGMDGGCDKTRGPGCRRPKGQDYFRRQRYTGHGFQRFADSVDRSAWRHVSTGIQRWAYTLRERRGRVLGGGATGGREPG